MTGFLTKFLTAVAGIEYDKDSKLTIDPNPGVGAGFKWKYHGQTGNTAAGSILNQGIGTVPLPALAAGASGVVTVTDGLVTSSSLVFLMAKLGPSGDGTIGRGVVTTLESVANGSFTFSYVALKDMANSWECHYIVYN